jgi:alpha-glucoside transport system substrate-binding protein
MTRSRLRLPVLLFGALAIAVLAASCGGGGGKSSGGTTTSNVSGSVSVWGIWVGQEQKNFQAVIDAFNKQYPNVKVTYSPKGNNLPTILTTAVQGGKPPDVAAPAQPGLVDQFVKQGKLKPIGYVKGAVTTNFGNAIASAGTFEKQLYGLMYKSDNKSTVFYNVQAYKSAGVTPAKDWNTFIKDAKTIKASGLPAYAISGADGWTLTDLFENLYLRTAGPQKYDQLTKHQIPWTDPSVKTALTDMAQVLSDTGNIYGGTSGALQTDLPTAVGYVLATKPKASQVIEGDFVPAQLTSVPIKPVTGYNEFTFPAVNGSPPSVVGAGNLVITFKNNPAIEAFVKFLATPAAANPWVKAGGFVSANKHVAASTYADPILRKAAQDLTHATTFKFDMSDLQPISFGGTTGQGEFKIFQDFLKNPSNINGTASALESAAAKAYKSS